MQFKLFDTDLPGWKTRKTLLFIENDVICFDFYNEKGDYCIVHYWKINLKKKGWENLQLYAKGLLRKKSQPQPSPL